MHPTADNLVLLLQGWKGAATPTLVLDGKEIAEGRDYRIGQRSTLDSDDTILWIKVEADKPLSLTIGTQAEKPKAKG